MPNSTTRTGPDQTVRKLVGDPRGPSGLYRRPGSPTVWSGPSSGISTLLDRPLSPRNYLEVGTKAAFCNSDDLGVNTFISDLSVLSLSLLRRSGVNYRNGCVFSGSWRVQDSRIAERKRLYRYRVTFSSLFLLLGCIAITHCTDAAYCYKRSAAWVSLSVKANSHCHARHDKNCLVCVASDRRCELDSGQLKTVADRKYEVWTR